MEKQPLAGTWEKMMKNMDPAQVEEVKRVIGARLIQENIVYFCCIIRD